jgi:hypothetical protein
MLVSRFAAAPHVLALPSCPKCGSRVALVQIVPYDVDRSASKQMPGSLARHQ